MSLSLLLFMVFTLGAAAYFVAMPIGQRSADDLAALMIMAANSWHESEREEHSQLHQQLLQDHGLSLAAQSPALPVLKIDYPYFLFLRAALDRRTGEPVDILKNPGGEKVWVDIPVDGIVVRVGIERTRVSARPPLVLLLVLSGGALLALVTSLAVVRRVVKPLQRLSAAALEVGHGGNPPPLAEDGPEELATLSRAFNRMSAEVHELLDNRTVMVAGISHDLRTPLTRLRLAIEMLGTGKNADLIADIRRDLYVMESLIKQFMELAQGLTDEREERLDLWQILCVRIENLRKSGREIQLSPRSACVLRGDPLALGRILANLLDNAVRYGNGKPIQADVQCDRERAVVRISDRGPGIPEAQGEAVFRPFHRLETANETPADGSGLGLTIARQLARKNGWTITLTPRTGGGTVAKLVVRNLHT